MNNKKKVSVLGLGYVGLPLFAAIAKSDKYEVVGFDPNEGKINEIKNGGCPIDDKSCEEDLATLEQVNVSADEEVLENSDIFIVCVPTPVHDGVHPDYSYVKGASRTAAKYLKKGGVVIVESTINPGTCRDEVLPEIEDESGMKGGEDFAIAHCPERINPGDEKWTVHNIARNVGTFPQDRNHEVADFYRSFIDAEVNEVSTVEVAEATKIVENTFRDVNIAFVNELAKSFDKMGIDLHETLQGSGNKPFAFMPHWPGRGVGGHCIAVDPYYLIEKAASVGFDHLFLKRAREINNSMPAYTVERMEQAFSEAGYDNKGKVVVFGLSYKPNIKDLRESPSFEIIEVLKEKGYEVTVFEPYAPDQSDYESMQEALEGQDAVIVSTAHDEFLNIDKVDVEKQPKVVVDGMNKLDRKSLEDKGYIYKGIGR